MAAVNGKPMTESVVSDISLSINHVTDYQCQQLYILVCRTCLQQFLPTIHPCWSDLLVAVKVVSTCFFLRGNRLMYVPLLNDHDFT